MTLSRALRARVVLALAVCAVLWSDPAFAELLCAATPACPHHATRVPQSSPANVFPIIAGVKSCCPAHSAPLQAPTDAPTCCAASDTTAVLPAASFASGQSRSKHALAALPSALFSLAPNSFLLPLSSERAVPYVQPIDQKKTDLRI